LVFLFFSCWRAHGHAGPCRLSERRMRAQGGPFCHSKWSPSGRSSCTEGQLARCVLRAGGTRLRRGMRAVRADRDSPHALGAVTARAPSLKPPPPSAHPPHVARTALQRACRAARLRAHVPERGCAGVRRRRRRRPQRRRQRYRASPSRTLADAR
jgi:hypothetical protein